MNLYGKAHKGSWDFLENDLNIIVGLTRVLFLFSYMRSGITVACLN